ncbi:HD domain-containing protein [Anoxynatronum buryatiense]|uniref:HD domain-containing protein n=1 Tax=Anoxynatronum buryatiense TaxID=489973 RepID=A0AA45WXA4_9CLOT|nr:HD domain-containing protein [Anoxynatronum buryatiense]SMP62715.1 HD domain-containing protein [Anoxynatronum buryatiense]
MKCLDDFITDDIRQRMEHRFFLRDSMSHEQRVIRYASMIFTVLSQPYDLGNKKCSLLYHAALLHDIGYEISPRKHDAHTRHIILKDSFFDFWPQPERTMLALIAGGHRKKLGPELETLTPSNQHTVKQLAAILRIADAIDYPRDERLAVCETTLLQHHLNLTIHSSVIDQVAARVAKKAALFEAVFQISVVISKA